MITTPVYCTREDVKSAMDSRETARNNDAMDDAIVSATASVESLLHRRFYPESGTWYFDYPRPRISRSGHVWLDMDELISVTSVTSGGVVIPPADYFLEPVNEGPPYTRIRVDQDSSASLSAGRNYQRSLVIAGVRGACADTAPAGTLAEALDASETGVNVASAAGIGVGSILLVDSEYMIVGARATLTSGQTLGGNLAALASADAASVTDGSLFSIGEVITIGSERMLIVDVTGNVLTVKRAWDGTVLAAHTSGATVYASRTLTVTRGALGTVAATHSDGAAVRVHQVPGLVRSLTKAEARGIITDEQMGGQTKAQVAQLDALRARVRSAHGRMMRMRSV